ncbi:MAG: hypothetical protein WC796_03010 [Candidatus Pacearchaeota archaeon]|jgi:hypothetical protein
MNSRFLGPFLAGGLCLIAGLTSGAVSRQEVPLSRGVAREIMQEESDEPVYSEAPLGVYRKELMYRIYPDKKLLLFINYPVDRWCVLVGEGEVDDLNKNKRFVKAKEEITIVFPTSTYEELVGKYDSMKRGAALENNCEWVDKGVLEIDNYPVRDWSVVIKPSLDGKKGSVELNFSFDREDETLFRTIYQKEFGPKEGK